MKKLLFVPIIGALAWLGSCSFHSTPHLNPSEIVQQAHEAFPNSNQVKHAPRHPVQKSKAPRPQARPVPDQAPVETLPPQQGPVCIFPLNFIPNCTPQDAGRMP